MRPSTRIKIAYRQTIVRVGGFHRPIPLRAVYAQLLAIGERKCRVRIDEHGGMCQNRANARLPRGVLLVVAIDYDNVLEAIRVLHTTEPIVEYLDDVFSRRQMC